jgi:hypothetical protein
MVRYSRIAHIFATVRDRGSGEVKGEVPSRHHLDEIDKRTS